jgi:hypothetical protein
MVEQKPDVKIVDVQSTSNWHEAHGGNDN